MSKVKLGIDFTKLAKLAHHSGKTRLSKYLIGYEKQIVKKIPFLLQIEDYKDALEKAIEGGDPNNTRKVFAEILKAHVTDLEAAIAIVAKVKDGLR